MASDLGHMTLKSIIEKVAREQQGNLPTPQASQVSRRREADALLQRYRGLQKAAKQPLKVEQTKCRLIDVCLMDLTPTKLCWKRASQLVKVGGFLDHEDLKATKRRCADALDLHDNPDNLVLVVKGAAVDQSAFVSLGSFMASFTAQQRAHFFFGIGIKDDEGCSHKSSASSKTSRDRSRSPQPRSGHDSLESKGHNEADSHSSDIHPSSEKNSGVSPSHSSDVVSVVPNYSFAALMQATEEKSTTMKLGSGGFGDVYMAKIRHAMVAVKFFREGNENLMSSIESLTKEASILSRYRHPNLVSIYGVCKDVQNPAVVYELMSNGSLYECIMGKPQNCRYLGHIEQRIRNLYEAACGLAFLHSTDGGLASVIHLDVKTTNILLDEHFVAKLGDFGFARQIPKFEAGKSFYHISASYGTPGYQAPECARGEISSKVDVFSFGVVVLEVFSELPAYSKRRTIAALHEFFEEALDPSELEVFKDLAGLHLKKASANWNVRIPYEPLQHLAKRCLSVRHRRPNMDEVVAELEALRHLKLVEAVQVL